MIDAHPVLADDRALVVTDTQELPTARDAAHEPRRSVEQPARLPVGRRGQQDLRPARVGSSSVQRERRQQSPSCRSSAARSAPRRATGHRPRRRPRLRRASGAATAPARAARPPSGPPTGSGASCRTSAKCRASDRPRTPATPPGSPDRAELRRRRRLHAPPTAPGRDAAPPRRQPVDEQVVVAQHPHERVLDELAGRPCRQQRLAVRPPGLEDRVTAGNSLQVAALGLAKKSALTKPATRNFRALRLGGVVCAPCFRGGGAPLRCQATEGASSRGRVYVETRLPLLELRDLHSTSTSSRVRSAFGPCWRGAVVDGQVVVRPQTEHHG